MRDTSLFTLVCLILLIQKQRRRTYLTKLSLTTPAKSAWMALFSARHDQAFIDTMGFDVASFMHLHDAIKDRLWLDGGRPPTLDTYACLGQ